MGTYTGADLEKALEGLRGEALATCRMRMPIAGGQPATERGLAAFVEHHLKLAPDSPQFEKAVRRIREEEIGERDATPTNGEVNQVRVYAVKIIRRTELGPYVAAHQIHANLKQAASRLGLWMSKFGSRGDMTELGTVEAIRESLREPDHPERIYLRTETGAPALTEYQVINGNVSGPSGSRSIQSHVEFAPAGSCFDFRFRWLVSGGPAKKVSQRLYEAEMALIFAAASKIGLGSCLKLGYGRWVADSLEINCVEKPRGKNS